MKVRLTPSLLLSLLACFCTPIHAATSTKLPDSVRLGSGWELQDAAKVTDTGESISRADYRPADWYRATVPGTVLTSLVNAGVYPEPLFGENNRPDRIPDSLCRTTYWYRAPFTVPSSFAGKRIWLTFAGINYIAEVFVNGKSAGTIRGAFIRGIFDVTSLVTVGAANAVAVHILPQPHPGETHEKTISHGTGPNGGVTGIDGPTFLCTIGWDWIPTIRDRDSGIWQDVTLSATGPVVIDDPYVASDLPLPRTDTADLTVQATLRNVTDTPQTGTLAGAIEGTAIHEKVSLAPGETKKLTFNPTTTPALRLKHPRLWWPNGYGPQNMYTLQLAFTVNGTLSDTRSVGFGVRKITYSLPGSTNLALSVNGVPVIAKGGDWGIDEAMKRIPRQRLDANIHLHKIANYTMIRNWVGQSTCEALYDFCDQYGILLWDEFFEPHPVDGPIPEDVPLYLSNVKDKLLRFRNHPCVALWCARNEGDPPPAIGDGIQKLIQELDPIRLYQPSSTSGRGVNSGGPYHWRTPREFYTYSEAFKTEIGSISVPTLEAIHAMMPSQDWDQINDDWAEHDFCAGAQQGDYYAEMISSRYGFPMNLADFVRKAQLANYECFRAMYEGRFAKLFQPETGVITWMSHPAQPSFVWQLYSHDLEPNSSLYATRKACEPIHIQLNQDNWHVMVINNTPKPLPGLKVKATIYNLDSSAQFSHAETLTAAPSAATDAGTIPFPAKLSPVHFVKLELRDAKDRPLSDNFYWRELPDRQDDLQGLNSLPLVPLEIQATRRDSGGDCRLMVDIHNPSRSIALMTHLQLRKARTGQRVLPVFYSDNYISLLPGERRQVIVEAGLSDFGADKPLIAVDGWNVTVKPASSEGKAVAVMPNQDALAVSATSAPLERLQETLSINCGGDPFGVFRFGSPSLGVFARDRDFKGGRGAGMSDAVDTNIPNAGPVKLYQTERWGSCTYTLQVKKGATYTVRLHFAEFKANPGERKFNVDINGKRVLADFDIAAEGGKGKAVVKDIASVSPDEVGHIVIALSAGSAGDPKICGIQIIR